MKARILLKSDASEAGEGWSDSRIEEALETSLSTVKRVRQQLVEDGVDAVLTRKLRIPLKSATDSNRSRPGILLKPAGVASSAE